LDAEKLIEILNSNDSVEQKAKIFNEFMDDYKENIKKEIEREYNVTSNKELSEIY
jgi:hypothetical protein